MKKTNEKKIFLKLLKLSIYLIIITILSVFANYLYVKQNTSVSFQDVENTKDYSYIDIYKMSEKFAYNEEKNIGIHFIIDKEDTGLWHTYLIAINESDYNNYKEIIDYTYNRIDKVPKSIRVYGYPVLVNDELKEMAIKNIEKFIPAQNETKITKENYETYLTNSYLDTTKNKNRNINLIFILIIILLFSFIGLFILTIFEKEKVKKGREK